MASWFTGLAGKAEALLERVDQTAADTLKTPRKETSNKVTRAVKSSNRTFSLEGAGTGLSGVSSTIQSTLPRVASEGFLNRDSREGRGERKSPLQTANLAASLTRPKSSQQLQNVAVTDEQLFEFLNAPGDSRQTRKSSLDSTILVDSRETLNPVKLELTSMEVSVDSNREDIVDGPPGGQTQASTSMTSSVEQGLREQVSNLELENRLLKREVTSLNQELTNVADRARQAEKTMTDLRKQLDSNRQTSYRSDNLVRELQGRHDDLVETLAARDSQIAVLRVKLQEADEKSDSNLQKIESLKVQNERVLQDHSDSHGVQHQVLEELRQKLEEAENGLKGERAALFAAQTQNVQQQTQMESERRQLTDSLREAQQKLTEERRRVNEHSQAIKNARTDADSSRKELSEYKQKAQRILQSKDQLINELKSGSSSNDASVSSVAIVAEVEQVKKERDLLSEEARACQLQLDHVRMELQDAEQQHQLEMDEKSERVTELEELLDAERRQREVTEQESARRLQEVEYTQTEVFREKTVLRSQLQERDTEIHKLRSQLTTRATVSVSQSELESRIHSLTENLIQKQTVIEALTSEKMSLSMQLERTQHDLTKAQAEMKPINGPTVLQGFVEDSGTAKMRPMSSILSSDVVTSDQETKFRQGVRKAANTVDRFSIRFGRFLRVYPSARVFLLVYMLVLHLWVLFILLTYSPEIHQMTI